jgi:Ran GTPase-activating protein (RanGAP) involved in mRNA processing and transport
MASRGGSISPRRLKKRKYNLACVEDEVSVRDILSEEIDTFSSVELISESEGECPSEESSNTSTESECESETSICTDEWEYALLVPNFQAKQLAQWLCGDLKSP